MTNLVLPLSGLIVVNASAIFIVTLVLVFSPKLERSLGESPDWFDPFIVGFRLARLTALTAIWNLKR